MIKKLLFLTLLAFYTGAQVQTPAPADPSAAMPEGQIIRILITINEGEVESGQIAKRYAKDKEVKEFAQQMVTEHKGNAKETKSLAKSLNINLDDSEVSKSLKEGAKSSNKNLKKYDKTNFDRYYVAQQIDMHEKALETIDTKLMPGTSNPTIRAHLEKTREHVSQHLAHAKELQSKLE